MNVFIIYLLLNGFAFPCLGLPSDWQRADQGRSFTLQPKRAEFLRSRRVNARERRGFTPSSSVLRGEPRQCPFRKKEIWRRPVRLGRSIGRLQPQMVQAVRRSNLEPALLV